METYRLRDEDGIARCYFSEQGIRSLFEDAFEMLELEEKELLTKIGQERYKMRIMVMKKKSAVIPIWPAAQRIGAAPQSFLDQFHIPKGKESRKGLSRILDL